METLILKSVDTSDTEPKRILCQDKNGDDIAVIYCDLEIKFISGITLNTQEFDQLKTVRDNFWLFYNNCK
jgi:hypothetical protein